MARNCVQDVYDFHVLLFIIILFFKATVERLLALNWPLLV